MAIVGFVASTYRYSVGPVGSMFSENLGDARPTATTSVLLPLLGSAEVAARMGEWMGT